MDNPSFIAGYWIGAGATVAVYLLVRGLITILFSAESK